MLLAVISDLKQSHIRVITFSLIALVVMGMTSLTTAQRYDTFYVSLDGDNSDGLSFATAWNELDQIQWDNIGAGDVIYIDGGADGMTYRTALNIGASGQSNSPITLKVAPDNRHNGQVTFFGGREQQLPYCGQSDYQAPDEDALQSYGIRTQDNDYVIVDGGRWRGIVVQGYRSNGIRVDSGSNNITIRHIEVTNNGTAYEDGDGWRPDNAGIRVGGANNRFERMIVHDNGQDAFQSLSGANNLSNFTIHQSWLYNERTHPNVAESSNYCTHTDGLQIFDGGTVSGVTITETIIGPGFTQSLILGQTPTDNGSSVTVNDVTLRDVLFMKAADNNVMSYRDTNPTNWTLDHVTIDCVNTKSHCLRIPNDTHSIQNSIIVDGLITVSDAITNQTNCVWNTDGTVIGTATNPHFVQRSSDPFSLDNYAPESECVGSRITSVNQLLGLN